GDVRAIWVRDPDLFRFSTAALRDPLPELLAAFGREDLWDVISRCLVKLGDRVVPHLLERLRSGDEEVRGRTLKVLGLLVPLAAACLPEMQRELTSDDDATLRRGAAALASLGPAARPALPRLLELLAHDDVEVRGHAAEAVAGMGRLPGSALP